MTIHTDVPQPNVKIPTKEDLISNWDALPSIVNPEDLLVMCGILMQDHVDKDEVIMALVSFINQFKTWQNILLGGEASLDELENLITGEGIVLDLTNDWFRRNKPMLEPVIMECKSCLTMVRILRSIGDRDKTRLDEEMELVWYQFVRMWDFIPWFVFMGTGNVSMYTSVKMLMARYCVTAKRPFIDKYTEMRKNG